MSVNFWLSLGFVTAHIFLEASCSRPRNRREEWTCWVVSMSTSFLKVLVSKAASCDLSHHCVTFCDLSHHCVTLCDLSHRCPICVRTWCWRVISCCNVAHVTQCTSGGQGHELVPPTPSAEPRTEEEAAPLRFCPLKPRPVPSDALSLPGFLVSEFRKALGDASATLSSTPVPSPGQRREAFIPVFSFQFVSASLRRFTARV